MTAPIAFTPMNLATSTDSADMPHVLGDPADATWKGTAERINDNFDAISAWCLAQSAALNAMRIPSASVTGANVISPATGWSIASADARTLSFGDGVKLVFLNLNMTYGGAAERPSGGLVPQVMGTLLAAYRPMVTTYYRTSGSYYTHGATYADYYVGCDLGITAVTGLVRYEHPSTLTAPGEAPTSVTGSFVYFTGSS